MPPLVDLRLNELASELPLCQKEIVTRTQHPKIFRLVRATFGVGLDVIDLKCGALLAPTTVRSDVLALVSRALKGLLAIRGGQVA